MFVPTAVLTKSWQVPVNVVKQSSTRAATSISTARPVNTAAPKSKVNYTLPKTYSYFKSHSLVRRAFNQKSAAKTNNLNEKVKTAKVNNVTTAGPKAVWISLGHMTGNKSLSYDDQEIDGDMLHLEDVLKEVKLLEKVRWSSGYGVLALLVMDTFYEVRARYAVLADVNTHITGNKSFFTDYQEIDGGFVAFGGSPKGGKITRKGKIRTDKLDFEDVYFVKELKFNLFSVSQICDKKNSVLFTKTECLALSPNLKLLDESQVLLKVLKHDNMYSFDLKNVVPLGGLTCLFAKATIDESNLWHRRLGHINFKTMNKLVRGNLVRGLPLKLFENDHTCVACQKGKQHKASCKTKLDETSGILKTFITGIENQINHKVKIIRCDNGTEFKNNDMNQFCGMKGIKREFSVARTPQQNGVAERKNRTLIEAARTMLADSLLPTTFWAEAVNTACYVQNRVLVTKPHNKTPYELLHGSGPDRLLIFDLLTNSMNMKQLLSEFKTNRNAGIKDNVDAVPTQQYIRLPLLYDSPQSSEDAVADDTSKKTNEEPSNEGERNGQEKERKEGYANSTNRVSTVSAVGQSFDNDDDLPTDPLMPDLEDTADLLNIGIFSGAYNDEDEGAEADLNNLEKTMNVSPIPTTRIHKDHLKDQIIGDINSATQTRRMTKISKEMLCLNCRRFGHWLIYLMARGPLEPNGSLETRKMREELKLETRQDWWHKMDVKSAFLYGTIEEEVYVCQPPGFEDPQFPDKVYKVEKALYGLHQAPRAWYETLSTYLLENGFRIGTIDKTLFIKKDKGDILLVQVKQKDDGIFISQDKYVADILKKFDFVTVKTASTLIETNKALFKDEEVEDVDVHLYRSMIRSLMYLTASRPDIMFYVCACARDSPFDLEAFSNSDYAGASLDRKSTTGGCQFLGKRLISWQCKKQTIVANSTTEAEYVATANCCGQAKNYYWQAKVNAAEMSWAPKLQLLTKFLSLEALFEGRLLEAEVPQDETEHEESVPTPSNDPQPSGEDSMQLTDLMVLCTKLQTRVLDLEKAKDAQAKERIQRLERKKKSRPTGLKRLKKVGMSRRVESSEDQESLSDPEDASKQGRSIADLDDDAALVDETQERQDDELMFDTRVLDADEMPVEAKVDEKDEQSTKLDDSTAGEAVTTASVEGSAALTTIEEITLAQTLIQIKAAKPKVVTTVATTTTTTRPKAREVVVQEPSEFRAPQEAQPSISKDKGKAKLDAELIEEQKLARKQEEKANIALIESWENTQAMMKADRLLAERLQSREREELTDEGKGKLFMKLENKEKKEEGREETAKVSRKKMLGRKRAGKEQQKESLKKQKVKEEKESKEVKEDDESGMLVHYELIKADESSKRYSSMIRMLQGIDKEDLEALWRIVKAKYGDTRPEDEFERVNSAKRKMKDLIATVPEVYEDFLKKKLEDLEYEHQV
ncbi:ribonuclease H-like domain-containing protein [Tanacetum coccineum]